ncbi:hypothetical protein K438DRAFT_440945 [Mycena galopus ATCC 62051]|nr:hypothetical protein K438DRAFT_440945 [Mycena galopus ATCC 62051]
MSSKDENTTTNPPSLTAILHLLEPRPDVPRPNRVLVYEAVILYLKEACTAGTPSRSPSKVARLRATLDGYLISMASEDAVSAIVESVECRKTLFERCFNLGLASDPDLRAAWRTDGERIATLLVSIFTSKSLVEAALRLEGDAAQHFLDVVQTTLEKGYLMDPVHTGMARRMIRKLSASSGISPSSIFVTGFIGEERHPKVVQKHPPNPNLDVHELLRLNHILHLVLEAFLI